MISNRRALGTVIWLVLAFSVGINVLLGSHYFVKNRLDTFEAPNLDKQRPLNTKLSLALDAGVKLRRYISFSLFDASEFHIIGTIRNLELAPLIYPGWVVRLYINAAVPLMYVEQFRMLGAEVIDVSAEAQLGLVNVDERLWRFLVADEADLDVFIDRDVHSRLSVREKCAVEEWLKSQSSFHCMRDHPAVRIDAHAPPEHLDTVIPGMFGMRNTWRFHNFTNFGVSELSPTPMRDLLVAFGKSGRTMAEEFLGTVLWPEMQSNQDVMCHDAFNCMDPRFSGSISFPCPRSIGEFVGQKMKGYHDKPTTPLRLGSNPPECRRNQEWQIG